MNKPLQPLDPHLCDPMAMVLQNQGITLTNVATTLFGYQKVASGDETYLRSSVTQDFLCVTRNSEGLEVALDPFGIRGRKQINLIRFVMEHAPDVKSPLAAVDYVRDRMPKAPAAPAAA